MIEDREIERWIDANIDKLVLRFIQRGKGKSKAAGSHSLVSRFARKPR